MADRTSAILGGGTGGLVAARRLRRSIDPGDRVVLMTGTPHSSSHPHICGS